MKYVALLEQDGVGCDYTIGCGKAWLEFDATDVHESVAYVRAEVGENYSHPDARLKAVTLVPVVGIPVPLSVAEIYAAVDAAKAVQAAERQRQQDEAEFARLAQKLGR